MKAIVLRENGNPSRLRLEDWPDPSPQAHEALIKVGAVGVPYHDIVERNGTLRPGHGLPKILGNEIAGTIVAIGSAVTSLRVGARICVTGFHVCGQCRRCRTGRETICSNRRVISGGYAEYAALPATALVPIPDNVDFLQACMLGSSTSVALGALRDVALLKLGEIVLVTGASGGVGFPAVQIAKAMGAQVIAVTRDVAKRDVLLEGGANNVIVSAEGADFSKEVSGLTGGEGVDVVVDTVGSRVFMPAFRSLADGGRYLVIGQLVREDIAINPARIIFKAATLSGIVNARRDQLEDTIKLVAAGIVQPRVAKVLPLAEAAQAHTLVEAGNLIGRVVLQP